MTPLDKTPAPQVIAPRPAHASATRSFRLLTRLALATVAATGCARGPHRLNGASLILGEQPLPLENDLRRTNCARPNPLIPGESIVKVQVREQERVARVFVPSRDPPLEGLPLVLNFHGTAGSAANQAKLSRLNPLAEEFGVVAAYPEGLPLDGEQVFDAGTVRDFSSAPRDDVAFSKALIGLLSERYCIDPARIYAMGMSNGARMSYRLACEASELIAAIAPVAGMLTIDPAQCRPSHPIAAIHFHGRGDRVSNYEGGGLRAPRSVPDNFALWGDKTGCTGAPVRVSESPLSHCDEYESCAGGAKVRLCSIEVMGHCWPGNSRCGMGEGSTELDASRLSLEFLLQFRNTTSAGP